MQEDVYQRRTMPYKEYLQSEYWKNKRQYFLKRSHGTCEQCKADGWDVELHVHHLTYENRGNEQDGDCIVLCKNCHAFVHNKLSDEEYAQWCDERQLQVEREYAQRKAAAEKHAKARAEWENSPTLLDRMRAGEIIRPVEINNILKPKKYL